MKKKENLAGNKKKTLTNAIILKAAAALPLSSSRAGLKSNATYIMTFVQRPEIKSDVEVAATYPRDPCFCGRYALGFLIRYASVYSGGK